MGFFSGVMGGSKQTIPASGFYAQPKNYQNLYKNLTKGALNTLTPGGQLNTDMFTPLAQTADETQAFDQIRQGLAPTAESLQSDLQMLMNPFDNYVVDDINKQSQGANSLVNQFANQAGQQGSNRSFLGSSDVEQNRLNSIGQFRQGQYNNSINNILGPLANLRQADIGNLLGIGGFERNMDTQNKQAPLSALTAGLSALNGIPTEFGNFGQKEQVIKSGGGLGGLLGGLGNIGGLASGLGGLAGAAGMGGLSSGLGSIGTALSFFSDKRMKENIVKVGEENGHNIYEFNYKNYPKRYSGVIAQEVQETHPEAVFEVDGNLAVNYEMLGIRMKEVV